MCNLVAVPFGDSGLSGDSRWYPIASDRNPGATESSSFEELEAALIALAWRGESDSPEGYRAELDNEEGDRLAGFWLIEPARLLELSDIFTEDDRDTDSATYATNRKLKRLIYASAKAVVMRPGLDRQTILG